MKKNMLYILIASAIVGIFYFLATQLSPSITLSPKQPNILLLSHCSLRKSFLYTPEAQKYAPNIYALMQKSYVFNNAHAPYTWTNISSLLNLYPVQSYNKVNYRTIGAGLSIGSYAHRGFNPADIPPSYFLHVWPDLTDYTLDYVSAQFGIKSDQPIFAAVHIKKMHSPYMLEDFDTATQFFDTETKLLLKKYMGAPQNYLSKMPLFNVLFPVNWMMKHQLRSQFEPQRALLAPAAETLARHRELKDLHENMTMIDLWKKSKNYESDLKMIKLANKSRFSSYDNDFGKLIAAMKENGSYDNTIIIFMGDHGEAFMEHGRLFHSSTVYDEMTTIPLFVHFPKQMKQEFIENQASFKSIYNFVIGLFDGKVSSSNFENFSANNMNEEIIFTRNCAGNLMSVRHKNQWKLIRNTLTNTYELFDLSHDPNELNDIYSDDHEIVWQLKELLLTRDENIWGYPLRRCVK